MKQNAKNDIVYDVLNRTILQKELDDDEEEKNKQLVHANTYTAREIGHKNVYHCPSFKYLS
jgi:hypothetical protein